MDEVCRVFNLDKEIVERYIQFGGVFNLLHAAASYLRIHQKGFGAVGVSGKYGKRSKQRYPIFWSLPKIGSLPNPDPADTADMDSPKQGKQAAVIDSAMEASRRDIRCRAQEWAGLTVDPEVSCPYHGLAVFLSSWVPNRLSHFRLSFVLTSHPSRHLSAYHPQELANEV
jgi:alpha-1,3-glucan synthase